MINRNFKEIILNISPIVLVLTLTFFAITCTNIEREPKVETGKVTDIAINSAIATGTIIDIGDGISDHGHCWSPNPNSTFSDFKTSLGKVVRTGSYTSVLQNLNPGTKYYIKAYVENNSGEFYYGGESSFTTDAISLPTITTTSVTSITSTTAVSGGNVTSNGGAAVTARGVCWSTNANPTVSLSTRTTNGAGTGSFTSNITGLTENTIYHVRAYATNSAGTSYGSDVTFTTFVAIIPPTVTTATTTATSSTTATSGGNVTSDGGATVSARGVCWSTSPNPTTSNSKTSNGSGTGSFSSTITGLLDGTTCYVRAFATNVAGTSYGEQYNFITPVTDIEGNIYHTVKIGSQIWMAENLKTTKYNNGTNIALVTNDTVWSNLSTPAYCWYNNDARYKNIYGALYNWFVAKLDNLCPLGWHVPTYDEWWSLLSIYSGEQNSGGALKETGLEHWESPNYGATNESGFTARPGGFRIASIFENFVMLGREGHWWTCSVVPDLESYSYFYFMSSGDDNAYWEWGQREEGKSIRCLKD